MNKKNIALLGGAFVLGILSGCTSGPSFETPSGQAELGNPEALVSLVMSGSIAPDDYLPVYEDGTLVARPLCSLFKNLGDTPGYNLPGHDTSAAIDFLLERDADVNKPCAISTDNSAHMRIELPPPLESLFKIAMLQEIQLVQGEQPYQSPSAIYAVAGKLIQRGATVNPHSYLGIKLGLAEHGVERMPITLAVFQNVAKREAYPAAEAMRASDAEYAAQQEEESKNSLFSAENIAGIATIASMAADNYAVAQAMSDAQAVSAALPLAHATSPSKAGSVPSASATTIIGAENVKPSPPELYTNSSHTGGANVSDAQAAQLGAQLAGVSLNFAETHSPVSAASMRPHETVTEAATQLASAPVQANARPSSKLIIRQLGNETPLAVTTTLLPVDEFSSPICGKVFKWLGNSDEASLSFSCGDGAVGKGSYVDGSERGEFVWGYALEADGSKVRVKTYEEWEDPMLPKSQLRAVQILYRYTSGPKEGQSYTTLTGPLEKGATYGYYMFRDYFTN
ncbi:hypothetical protein JQX08_08160 [Pseudomonas sp. UL073]|uniref:Lipoprotein n=1 Tax=Zestomonas insulae TaxID=2809017 RepID=A0ABS2IC33_9GAMM|nr:hypothetical protein [Pseudomonas insulae]MBM7060681.1 hypothetical protein [Pseudomonas insulae]